jgi:mRNA interferase MazF
MTTCSRWDIVLVPFPFTDLRSSKKRPALVVSPDEYNGGPDVVIAFITSQMKSASRPGDYHLKMWQESGLPKPSMVRMKFATIERGIVIKKLGRLAAQDREEVRSVMRCFFE